MQSKIGIRSNIKKLQDEYLEYSKGDWPMKKLLLGLTIISSLAYPSSDKYEKSPSDPEANGKTTAAAKSVAKGVADTTAEVVSFIIKVPVNLFNAITENGFWGEQYVEIDTRLNSETDEFDKKSVRISTERFLAGHGKRREMGGVLPLRITVAAEAGEGITIEEARLSVFRMMSQEYGIKFDYFTIGHNKPIEYTIDAISEYNYLDLIQLGYNDILWSSKQKGVDLIIGGHITGGGSQGLKSYDEDIDVSGSVFQANGSAGVRLNDIYANTDIIFEAYTKNLQIDGSEKLSRNGAQLVLRNKKSKYALTMGAAKEEFEGSQSTKKGDMEYYIRGKIDL